MEFSVNIQALPGLAELLERRRLDLENTRTFVDKYATVSHHDSGIINDILGTHRAIVEAVDTFLTRAARERADRLSSDVWTAVDAYRRTDVSASARLDAALPIAERGGHPAVHQAPANQNWGPAVFDDPLNKPVLAPPHDYRWDYQVLADPSEMLSPTSYLRETIWEGTKLLAKVGLLDHPIDILQEYFQPLAGDWATFRACADVFDSAATQLDFQAGAVDQSDSVIPLVWTGHAAANCRFALRTFGADLQRAAQTLRNAAENYRECAETVKLQTEIIIGIATAVCDICADLLAESVGGAAAVAFELVPLARRLATLVNECRKAILLCLAAVGVFVDSGEFLRSSFGVVAKIGPLELTPVTGAAMPYKPSGSQWTVAE